MGKNDLVAFDYSDLDADTKGKLLSYTADANRAIKKYGAGILELGETCFNANELLAGKGREGKFKPWVEGVLGISKTSAYEAMNVYERSLEFPGIATLPPSVALMLSKPGVSDKAIKAFQKQVDKGVKPTIAGAKAVIDEHKEVSGIPDTSAPTPPEPEEYDAGEPDPDDEQIDEPEEAEEAEFDPAVIEAAPPKGIDIAALSEPYKQAVNDLNRIRREMRKLADEESTGAHLVEKINRIEKAIDDAKTPIAQATPTEICPKCNGKKCVKCSNTGWWPKSVVEALRK